jgi:hypothetical protein
MLLSVLARDLALFRHKSSGNTCHPFILSSPASESGRRSALIFGPGESLPPRGYFVRLAPFAWRSISKPLSPHHWRTVRLRRRTARPPEFLPQSRRSRLRRHQQNRGRASSTLTNRLGSGFATPTRVSPSFALRAATRAIPLPRGLTSSRSLGLRDPPFNLSARRRCRL